MYFDAFKFNSLLLLLLAPVLLASPVSRLPTEVSQVEAGIRDIAGDIAHLKEAVDNYNGATISELIAIANAESRTENDIKNLNNQLKVFSPFDSTDSQTIVNTIDKTLAPEIPSVLNSIADKKDIFGGAGLLSIAQTDLKNLQSETNGVFDSLIEKLSSDTSGSTKEFKTKIAEQFREVIELYAV